ncbi:MAG: endolytic transglycosylase MltG [Niabella sp.]
MAKKKNNIFKVLAALLLLVIIFIGFKLVGPAVRAPEKGYLYIKTGSNMTDLKNQIANEKILSGLFWFNKVSGFLDFTQTKPGRYKIKNGMSVLSLVRMLRNGQQSPVSFVVTKIRTREQLAGRIGNAFECDSLSVISFLNNNDSLQQYNLDSNTIMSAVLPLTYESKWSIKPRQLFDRFYDAYQQFWTDERKQKAAARNLTPSQIATIASIVDEETNAKAEMGNIASVYMNRMAKGMPLQADPTIKFALKDFGIKRVLLKHLEVRSPYNTYRNKGLPPSPICTPQLGTIDSVLNAPQTDYIYFVASTNFDGTHVFSSNYNDHLKYAKAYQAELNKRFPALPANNP